MKKSIKYIVLFLFVSQIAFPQNEPHNDAVNIDENTKNELHQYSNMKDTSSKEEKSSGCCLFPPLTKNKTNYNNYIASLATSFNTKDFFLGLTGGIFLPTNTQTALSGSFYIRPYEKSVFREIEKNTYYQLKEVSMFLSLNVEQYFSIKSYLLFYLVPGIALVYNDFSGFYDAGSHGSFRISTGFAIRLQTITYKIGYQYIYLDQSPPNQINLEISFML